MRIRVFYAWRDQVPPTPNFALRLLDTGELAITRTDAKMCAAALRIETENVQ